MKTLTEYQCEVCGTKYRDAASAEACEAQPNPEIALKVGEFVGYGAHGWWGEDKSWTRWTPAPDGHPYAFDPRVTWLPPSHPDTPVGATPPISYWFLPIWRVVAVRPAKPVQFTSSVSLHRLEYVLWTPRHANGGPERIVRIYADTQTRVWRVEKGQPYLTEAEIARFHELTAGGDALNARDATY